jgi:hypothetical protein
MQRFVYVMAKDHHTDDPNEGSARPTGMQKGKHFNQSTPNL